MNASLSPEQHTAVNRFLQQPLLARLATTPPETLQPHLTTVWYLWDGESAWMSIFSSTRKLKELEANPRCALLIDVEDEQSQPRAVLLEGSAVLLHEPADLLRPMFEQIYLRYLGPEGILAADPQSWLEDPENTLVRLAPDRIYTW